MAIQFPPPSTAPDDARAVTSSDPLAPAQRDAYTAMQGQKKLVRAREGGRGERKSSGYHAVDQLDVGLSCETDRERERIRTVRRRVYVPSIGHVSLLFSTTAAAVSTAGGLDRERERELIEIERERETRVIAVDVVEFLHQLLRALLRDLFTQWVCVCV